ncbi:MAG: hypothetical protein R3C68_17305 [Myxococcota bacterium]
MELMSATPKSDRLLVLIALIALALGVWRWLTTRQNLRAEPPEKPAAWSMTVEPTIAHNAMPDLTSGRVS